MTDTKDFNAILNHHAQGFGFSHFGWTPLHRPHSLEIYEKWIEQGYHASMEYLKRHARAKADESTLLPRAQSAIVIAKSYLPHPYDTQKSFAPRTALYARGRDYHEEFQSELQRLVDLLKVDFPEDQFLCFTDSVPLLERDLAARAGLGWIGKNTCLIHPKKGSLFFIGEILSTLQGPPPPAMVPDMCGTCDRCIRACPTQALIAPKVLDANRCIAFWTIESRAPAPENLRPQFGDWFFGCDICQTVCPWNEKVFGKALMRQESATITSTNDPGLIEDLRSILDSSNAELRQRFQDIPFTRARSLGLKRNALYVVGNLKLNELKPIVQSLQNDPDLGELARWALITFDN